MECFIAAIRHSIVSQIFSFDTNTMASRFPETICPRCLKKVLDSEKGIKCDNECSRWFHVSCIDMPDSIYNKYASNANKVWQCDRADCSKGSDGLQIMSEQLSEVLRCISSLPTKNDLAAVNASIAELKQDLSDIRSKINGLEPRMEATESRLDIIENKIASVSQTEDIISELNDRTRRAFNVLVYNIPEKKTPDTKSRIEHDKALANKLTQVTVPNVENKLKVFRIGKPTKDRPRPMKIVFLTEVLARQFCESFSQDLVAKTDEAFKNISISRDRTPKERQHLNDLRSKLETRTKNGEKNLTIRYRNGIPTILNTNSKNL